MPTNPAKIEHLPPQLLQDALEIINIANFSLDQTIIGRQILDVLFRMVYAESSVLFLTDESKKITTSVIRNLSEEKSNEFINHFCRLDPLQLVHGEAGRKNIFRLDQVVDYHSFLNSEYYNDFYKPQNIYHKLVINLQAKGRLYGEICMHRPSDTRNFSRDEIRTLQSVTPYFVHALEHNELRRKIRFKDSLLNIIDDNLSTGVIILDNSLNMVYINKQARAFCNSLFGYLAIQKIASPLPLVLIEDCHKIKKDIKEKTDIVLFPKTRVFQNDQLEKFNVTSRLIEEEFSKENCDLYMISIEKMSDSRDFDADDLKKNYQVTDREAEIAAYIFKGLKNAEIAQKLFVSEITVKWHIRNLFEKIGVKNRTALVHKVLFQEASHPPKIKNIMV